MRQSLHPHFLVVPIYIGILVPDDLAVLAAIDDGPAVQAPHHAHDVRLEREISSVLRIHIFSDPDPGFTKECNGHSEF